MAIVPTPGPTPYYGPAFGPNFAQTTGQNRQMQSIPGQFNAVTNNVNPYKKAPAIQPTAPQNYTVPQDIGTPNQGGDPYAGLRNDIGASWDEYLGSLGGMNGYLNDSRAAQEGIANSQYEQGVNMANTQKAASLRDIANTTRNAFQAGNNYLGSLGAGDSSAANQYSFAINQQANKQTGDLNAFVDSQMQNLKSTHDQQIQAIASWFAGKQQELQQMVAQGKLSKGQDMANLSKGILDQAIQATNALKANSQNQYNALVNWAANNSQNMSQLRSNIAQIPQAMGQINMQGNAMANRPMFGGTPASNTQTDIFGNPIV